MARFKKSRNSKVSKTLGSLAVAEAALALAKDRAGGVTGKNKRGRPSNKLLAGLGAVAVAGVAAIFGRKKVDALPAGASADAPPPSPVTEPPAASQPGPATPATAPGSPSTPAPGPAGTTPDTPAPGPGEPTTTTPGATQADSGSGHPSTPSPPPTPPSGA